MTSLPYVTLNVLLVRLFVTWVWTKLPMMNHQPLKSSLSFKLMGGHGWPLMQPTVPYVLVRPVDGNAHIEQVSVHPIYARRGVGRELLQTAAEWAHKHDLTALTLTTFAHVPWNAPYYQRLGFLTLNEHEVTTGLRRIREHEATLGLDRWPRVVMRRDLATPSTD